MRPSWVEVDLDAIAANVAAIRAEVAPALVCAVVKADAYGHGDVPAAEAAMAGGAEWLAVALVEEGRRLREAGIEVPILLLSEPEVTDAAAVVEWSLRPTVYREGFATALGDAALAAGVVPYPVHVKVNTGMHRVGAEPLEAFPLVRQIAADDRLSLEGLWTHLAVAEEDPAYTTRQLVALGGFRSALEAEGIDVPIVHTANTAGALDYPDGRFDLVRVGLGIYGLRPDPGSGPTVALRPAMRVVSQVALVRRLPAGERPSYGRRRPLEASSLVATVPMSGTADGVARRLSSVGGEVLIRGLRYPFAGTVTMDQVVIDVGEGPVAVGDEVVLLGAQGDEEDHGRRVGGAARHDQLRDRL